MMIKQKIKQIDRKYLNAFVCRTIGKIKRNKKEEKVYNNQFEEYIYDSMVREELEHVDPKRISSSGRLDIMVRYLLFKELAYGNVSDKTLSLYSRTILSRSGAIELQDYYSPDEKKGIQKHLEVAKELLESIKTNGFEEKYYVPIGKDFGLYNGAHRMAAAMALNENVWIRTLGEQGIKDMDFQWFINNGFSWEDQIRVLRAYADIHEDCGIFVLYGTVEEQWSYILKQIEKMFVVVGNIELDFSNDYIAFENLIHDIYMDYNKNSVIERKIELLKFARLAVKVVLVSDEKNPEKNLYEEIIKVKNEIRNGLQFEYPNEAYITLHASDSKEEFKELKQIVLSVNNLKYLHMRFMRSVRKEFLLWINDFKKFCMNNGINVEDTCIVGSSPLEVLGIRESTDIDIVVSPELRNKYGDGVTHLTSNLDIATRNYVRNYQNVKIYDEQLIYDDNQHFIFMGCKFANVDSVKYRKQHSDRDKDIRDVRRIEIFEEYYKFFDNKKILQEQIDIELRRRGLKGEKKSIANKL